MTKITVRVEPVADITETEKEILYWDKHNQRGDCNENIIRSSFPRIIFKGKSIPARSAEGFTAHRGDVLIVNDNLEHYRGELWVVCHDIEVSNEYNVVGHVPCNEQILLDWIRPDSPFGIL